MIDIDSLSLSIAGSPILQDITASIPQGGITALIGPNGAGKSSLLHCIAGLLVPQTGAVRVDGMDIAKARPEDRARRLALLTQSQHVATRLTVQDLVAFGRWPHHRGRPGPQDRAIVAEAIAGFELQAVADRPLDTLSGGQRQRAFIAMAHAQDTPWMLLDEPLAALDPRYAKDIMTRLKALAQPGGRSIVVVLHDLGAAARWADHVLALKAGRVFAAGPRAEVLSAETLSALFDTGFAVERVGGQDVVFPT